MVDIEQLQKANALNNEKQNLIAMRAVLDHEDGMITGMTGQVLPWSPDNPPPAVISTVDFHYPAQMIDGIKSQINSRLHAVEDELTAMGVTGVEPGPRGGPPPRQPPQPQPRQPPQPRAAASAPRQEPPRQPPKPQQRRK